MRYGTMIRWQFHGIGVLTRVRPLNFKDHDGEDDDEDDVDNYDTLAMSRS